MSRQEADSCRDDIDTPMWSHKFELPSSCCSPGYAQMIHASFLISFVTLKVVDICDIILMMMMMMKVMKITQEKQYHDNFENVHCAAHSTHATQYNSHNMHIAQPKVSH